MTLSLLEVFAEVVTGGYLSINYLYYICTALLNHMHHT